jgi:beta-galactosidase
MQSPLSRTEPVVRLARNGILLGDEVLPLKAGSVHYFRHAREAWEPILRELVALGFGLVDTYVPWNVHEHAPGDLDFGTRDTRLDIAGFVDLAHTLGLKLILRPGPHVNAELTGFGIPEHVLWDPECQARSPSGKRVVLPVPPQAFPVPSYASDRFHELTAAWFGALGGMLASRLWPHGPIVLVQVDNEAAFYFRDGVYDQDHHPDALRHFHEFLSARYPSDEALRAAYRDPNVRRDTALPPRKFAAKERAELAPHLDFAEFQEELLARALGRMRTSLEGAGFVGVPFSHNLPPVEHATPLDPAQLDAAAELVGIDYYHHANEAQRRSIAKRTTELEVRSSALGVPAFAAELGSGFPPYYPVIENRESEFAMLTALAYGLRGFNLYMAADRDRWIGSPIDSSGRRRPEAEFYLRINSALERTRLFELERVAQVGVVVPRNLRRLVRVAHAFGPATTSALQAGGGGAALSMLEDPVAEPAILADTFVEQLVDELESAEIPYSIVSGDLVQQALQRFEFCVVAWAGSLDRRVGDGIARAGAFERCYFGPVRNRLAPETNDLGRSLDEHIEHGLARGIWVEDAAHAVRDLKGRLSAPAWLSPRPLQGTLFREAPGHGPRVAFVINPSTEACVARVCLPGVGRAKDALEAREVVAENGVFEIAMKPLQVRMLELSGEA